MKKPQLSELTLREKIGQTGCISSGALVGNKTRKELIERNCFGAPLHPQRGAYHLGGYLRK